MGLVAIRVTIGIVLVAGDGIVPIHHVHSAVRSDLDVDGPKITVS